MSNVLGATINDTTTQKPRCRTPLTRAAYAGLLLNFLAEPRAIPQEDQVTNHEHN